MRATNEVYEEVAEHCSRFSPISNRNSYSNSYSDSKETSCKNCSHFDDEEYCELDLYDQIVENRHLDNFS